MYLLRKSISRSPKGLVKAADFSIKSAVKRIRASVVQGVGLEKMKSVEQQKWAPNSMVYRNNF